VFQPEHRRGFQRRSVYMSTSWHLPMSTPTLLLTKLSVYAQYQSNGACHDTCQQSYAYAIVQYQDCWCSNYAPANTVSVDECNVQCPGYGYENCGNQSAGLYGYIRLNVQPSGTIGGSSSTASSTQTSSAQSTSAQPSVSPFSLSMHCIIQNLSPVARHPSIVNRLSIIDIKPS